MNRRQFLVFSLAGAAALSEAVAKEGLSKSELEVERDRARALGKPLLVLVIPRDSKKMNERGDVFGVLLNRGDAGTMATLSLAHVVCAKKKAVRGVFGPSRGEPLAVLAETTPGGAVVAIDPVLPELPPYGLPMDVRLRQQPEKIAEARLEEERAYRDRSATLADAIAERLIPDSATLTARVAQSRASLTAAEAVALAAAGERAPEHVLADRCAAIFFARAERAAEEVAVALERSLADAAIARLRKVPPPGAKWAVGKGCGIEIERQDDSRSGFSVLCGMGYVPDIARRFLYLHAES